MGIFNLFNPDIEKLKKKKDIEGLVKSLGRKDKNVHRAALDALKELGDYSVENLRGILEDYDSNLRIHAAEALGRIEGAGVAILRVGLVQFVNKRVTEINHFSKKDLVGKQFIKFVAPDYRKIALRRYKKRISYEYAPSRYEVNLMSKEGGEVSVEINASLIEFQGRPADLVIIKEITKEA